MAKKRRAAHYVEEAVLRLLTGRSRAINGLQLVEMMRDEGDIVPLSQIYRTLRTYVERGAIRKVHVAGGYVVVGNAEAIMLYCQHCGALSTIPDSGPFTDLRRLAAVSGFNVSHSIVEVTGICGNCYRGFR